MPGGRRTFPGCPPGPPPFPRPRVGGPLGGSRGCPGRRIVVVSVPVLGSPWWVGRAASLKSPPGLSWAWEGGAGVPRTSPTFLLEPLCVVNSARPGNRSLEVAQLRPRPAGLSCQPLFLAPLCYGKLNLRVLVAVPFPVPPRVPPRNGRAASLGGCKNRLSV